MGRTKIWFVWCITMASTLGYALRAEEESSTVESSTVESSTVMSDSEWSESLKVWIARAMVSEAGWEETADHVAIAYVLHRRWIQVKRKYPRFSMTTVISRYCAGFGKTVYSKRQKWIKNLQADGSRPTGWPSDLFWRDYKDRWLSVLNTAEEWRLGLHPDPCNGLSRYWGGPMDRPSKRMIRMDCGDTKNYFYTVRTLLPENTQKEQPTR